jgi:hypothetical protein
MGIYFEQPKFLHSYWQKDHKRREKAGIYAKLLFHPKTDISVLRNRNSYKYADARYMPAEINTPAGFFGYKNVSVITIPSDKPVSIEIINEEIANSFRAYFEEFWKKSKPLKK